MAQESSDPLVVEMDAIVQARVLPLLCERRRQDVNNPGIGDQQLERLSSCQREHLEFHLGYLKAKGFIARTENGTFAITINGIDRAYSERHDSRPIATRCWRASGPSNLVTGKASSPCAALASSQDS